MEGKAAHAATLEQRNAALERDVLRFKERQNTLKRIEEINLVVLYKEFKAAQSIYKEAKGAAKSAKKNLALLQKQANPMNDRKNQFKRSLEKAERKVTDLNGKSRLIMDTAIPQLVADIEAIDNSTNVHKSAFSSLKKKAKENDAKMRALVTAREKKRAEIEKLQETMIQDGLMDKDGNELPRPGTGRIKKLFCDKDLIKRELDKISSMNDDVVQKRAEITTISNSLRDERDSRESELRDMSNVKNMMLDKIKTSRMYSRVFDVYHWLQNNQDKFEKPILGPVCLYVFLYA